MNPSSLEALHRQQQPEIRRRTPKSQRRRDGLIQFARDKTSQNGEDGIIAKLFELLPLSSTRSHRVCVDVGAWDGKHLSNTYSLLVEPGSTYDYPWTGLLIEADTERFKELQALHEPLKNTCNSDTVSSDPASPHSLPQIISNTVLKYTSDHVPPDLDFISIDVDGSDYWLLHDLWHCTTMRPMVVCIEANPTMPNDLIYIPPRNDNIRHGASLAALVELAESFGYVLVETTVYNAFFVPRPLYLEHLQDLVPDTSIEALHEITMGTSLYQLYDGTLKLWGCKRLLWHRMGISEEQIQVLPQEERAFPFAPTIQEDAELEVDAVDVSAYCVRGDADASSKAACSAALLERLSSDGFVLVRGTGISSSLCRQASQMTQRFLHDADESVRRSCLTKDRARRGYAPMCTENFASLIGEQGPNDLVRKFRVGATARDNTNGKSVSSPLHRPNVWPSSEDWPEAQEFQAVIEDYFEAVHVAAGAVVAAIVDGLVARNPDLERSLQVLKTPNEITNTDERIEGAHSSILTLLGYRHGARHKKRKNQTNHPLVAAHTDVGIITMLQFDGGNTTCATLQRQCLASSTDGQIKWIDVPLPAKIPDDPIWVINIADCFSELSHNEIPCTLHRVIPQSGPNKRTALALFMGLDPDAMLELPDSRVLSYEEWRKERIAKSQAVLSVKSNNE
eukprot:Nitzschia sp. Nitz4//scaffold169_size48518//26224//28335//NITZ4_007074-RA/size48518-snap-gene-0.53-mRNA-1//1//CDS//3329538394//6394//frame0